MTYRTTTTNLAKERRALDLHVGARLRLRREAMKISQGHLGNTLGVSFSQVQKYEKGTNRIGAGSLWLLARALMVDVTYFYEGLGETANTNEVTPRVIVLAEHIAMLPEAKLSAVESLVTSML